MTMTTRIRRIALIAHIVCTLGWLGAIMVFVALAVIGLTSSNAQTVRGAYLVMEPAAWYVLVPLAVTSLLTGLIQALGSAWGLLRHYWVVFKLVITLFATIVLLIFMETFRMMAGTAADPAVPVAGVRAMGTFPRDHAAAAALLLLAATVLAVYKPKGMTRYGQRSAVHRRTTRLDST